MSEQINGPWKGFRELVLVEKVEVCPGIISFYFKAKDGGKLVKHKPGQFLPMKIKTDDDKYQKAIRTYSLSMLPNEDIYRISVKKVENGLISTYLHEKFNVGDSIEATMPAGKFVAKDKPLDEPMVLLSGGIGITPVISMLYDNYDKRDNIYFIQAVQNSYIHPFKEDIANIVKLGRVKNTVFYSEPLQTDKKGIDYDEVGFVNKEWLKQNIPLNGEFYFCGPPPFMKALESALLELGVDQGRINYELFG